MCHRRRQEAFEKEYLSPYAMRVSQSKGRERLEEECEVRTAFQRDRDRILHSKAFRRMAHKTQVFISPEGDHYRTRLTHTLEVAQIARTLARALRLNEDLTEAIALGHDLGHTPFGHTGERVLSELTERRFSHNKHSLRVVEKLENEGKGLNLTYEVRDGIVNHPTSGHPQTLEGCIVQIADKIAYINHDIDDAIRGKVLTQDDLPLKYRQVLGETSSIRINRIIMDLINESNGKSMIKMSQSMQTAFYGMRQFLFDKVYIGSSAKEQEGKAEQVIRQLYAYYIHKLEALPPHIYQKLEYGETKEQLVCDYIAGMTDRYAIHCFCDLFFPASWNIY
ncbi:deoxyguanosinetriphosphate triphosphohydrolase [Sporanaerobium hydrogeniformans]|uniref:Deoxyguanosinetriphosphate triphosphohydrolase n=1 Tax=Sporanaerobium hydrogeniformans TaxID=3072179 RepID=A0AC61DE25_9FIRM|nr:deoxyguanosinetriphosphate triphosphohydrolase [Sporanaerobium hydrogeniformans]PHV71063.1 deoxyguanosinetriphosphate triphosphohydrolase [Sporanaerobium hydrogeniformans]